MMQYSKYAASRRQHREMNGINGHRSESIAYAESHVETQHSTTGNGTLEVNTETHIYHDVIFQVDPNGTITLIPSPDTVQVSRSFSSARACG